MQTRQRALTISLLILLLLITIYSRSADYSKPAGLIKIGIPPGEERLSSTPFDPFDSNLNFLLSGQLTGAAIPANADQLKIWDASSQDFKSAFLADSTGDHDRDGKWFKDNVNWEPSDIVITPGIGFFITNNQLMPQTLMLSGRVPMDDSRILTIQPDLNLFSYPFPSKISLNSGGMKNTGAKGGINQNDSPDLVITHSPDTEHWLMDKPSDPDTGKWLSESDTISTLEFKIGTGYWYERHGLSPFQWRELRPYQNPFSDGTTAPTIADMVFNMTHDEVTLDIDCTGASGETLEIFFKDLCADDSLVTENGWLVADQNISTSGNTHVSWTDSGRVKPEPPCVNRNKINSTFMRIFIVSRQDIDSDSDGISNGREKFVYATMPDNPDTDGDGISDGDEINIYLTNPNMTDTDSDGYPDSQEIDAYHTDPNNAASNPAIMPPGWIDADIGSPGTAGSAKYFNGTYTVKGAGADIYGTSDKFNYLYQDLYGDCTVTARVTSQQNSNPLAKAGIMIRENLNANSRNAFAFITPGTAGTEKCYYQERTAIAKASTRSVAYASATAYPYWLKLVKKGNVYSSYKSANGTTWTAMCINRTIPMGNAVKIGFAATGMNNTSASAATFDSLSITKTIADAPSISPNGGYFQMNMLVTLSASVPDSQIRYTTDNSEPAETSTLYIAPFTIDTNRTVKAKLFKPGYNPGPTATAMFNQPGLMVKYYAGSWTTLPDFSTLSPYKVSMIPNIDYSDNYGHVMTSERNDNVGAVITGQINCPVRGEYRFYLSSGEGAALHIDGKRLIYSPKLRTFAQTASPAVTLTTGLHDIKIEYFEATDSGGLQLKWSYPRKTITIIPPENYFSTDSDGDGLPDQWEFFKSGNLSHTGTEDSDADGFSDRKELNLYFTDPSDPSNHPLSISIPDATSSGIALTYCAKNKRRWTAVPDFDRLPHYGTTSANQINFIKTTAKFATSGTATNVAAQFNGFIEIPSNGLYKFYLNCDDGANLYIDSKKTVDNDGLHAMRETYGFASLKAGKHEIRVDYYQTTSYNGLILSYEGPGLPKQIVPASAFFHSPQYLLDMINTNDPDSDGVNTITASSGANGSISPVGAVKMKYGADQSFSVTPNTNYRVSDVLVDGVSAGAVTNYQFTNVKAAHTIIANFALDTHTVTFDPAGYGSRTGGGELCQTINHGTGATTPAITANAGWTFIGWDKPFNNITADTTVTAQYSRITHTITFIAGSNGTISGTKVQTINHGDSCETVTAVPDIGYHFVNWTGDITSTSNSLTVSNVTSDITITANFAINTQQTLAGALFGTGYNDDGELGDGTITSKISPVKIVPSGVISISAGGYHSLFLMDNESLWATGQNSYGQMGDGITDLQLSPVQIVPSGVTAIAAGGYHSLFLKDDGSLWGMGYNDYGQLGDGTTVSQSSPVQILPSGVTAIAAGSYHSLFLKDDGSLWAMGYNYNGQLGDRTTVSQSSPVQILPSGVTAISAGDSHSLFLKDDGSLWAMGCNDYGQLGDGTTVSQSSPVQILPSGVTAISAGGCHTLFMKDNGSVWGMGYNDNGELGDGTTTSKSMPTLINISDVTVILSGGCHSLFLKNDGSLWTTGYNYEGELGDGTTDSRSTPVKIISSGVTAISAGYSHSLFLKNKFTVTFLDGANGSISGSHTQTVNYGDTCSLVTAVPSTEYHFASWTKGEVPYSADAALTVTNVTDDMTLSANFASNANPKFTVNFIAGENGSIKGTESQSIYAGESGTSVTGIPDTDYHFVNWTGTGGFAATTDNPIMVSNVTSEMTITANFASNSISKHTVNFIAGDNGSLTGTLSQAIYPGCSGTSVTAIPATGYHFVNWTGTDGFSTTSNPLTVSNVTSHMDITANFASNSNYRCTVNFIVMENGSINGATTQKIFSGESGTPVTAVPDTDYHFVNWTGTGLFVTTTDNPMTVSNVESNMEITANFGIYHFVISENPLPVNEGETASCSVALLDPPASDVTVTISHDSGYDGITLTSPSRLTFTPENWAQPQTIQFSCPNDNDSDSKTTAFTLKSRMYKTSTLYLMEKDKDIVISVNADNNGSVSPSGRIPKRIGDVLTAAATPDINFLFDHWEGDVPEEKIHLNPLELTIEKPSAITAVFSNNYRAMLKVNDVPSEWLTVSPKFTGGWESDISLYRGIAGAVSYLDDIDLTIYLYETQTSTISDGFESGAISNWVFGFENSDAISVVDNPVFAGSKSLKLEGSAGNVQGIYHPTSTADKDSKLGFYIYLPSGLGEGNIPSAIWYNGICISFCYQQNGSYTVRLGESPTGTVTHSDIAASTWNYVELNFDNFVDTDFDGMDDDWEIRNFGDLNQDANGDFDHDGISNLQEFLNGKDPKIAGQKVFFTASSTKVNKSAGTVNIEVKIDPAPQKFPVTAQVILLDSTAKNGIDFSFTSPQIVVFGVGETTKTGPVTVIAGDPSGSPEIFARFGLTPQQGIGIGTNESFILYIDEIAEDMDNDGLPDWWEMKYFGNLNQEPNGDPDSDGVTNIIEYKQGRHPNAGAKADRTNRLKLEVSF
jgi:uncharacterized repeat protein (TIGR02543 family)